MGAPSEPGNNTARSAHTVRMREGHVCARQCASYSHMFPMAGSAPGRFLLPLIHLVNHDGVAPNVAVEKDAAAGVYKGVALRDIAAGEQVMYRRACALRGGPQGRVTQSLKP